MITGTDLFPWCSTSVNETSFHYFFSITACSIMLYAFMSATLFTIQILIFNYCRPIAYRHKDFFFTFPWNDLKNQGWASRESWSRKMTVYLVQLVFHNKRWIQNYPIRSKNSGLYLGSAQIRMICMWEVQGQAEFFYIFLTRQDRKDV